jgi:hypothetical protein
MQLKFYLSLNRRLIKSTLLSSLMVIILCISANAQKHNNQGLTYGGGSNGGSSYSGYGSDWGIALNAGYDSPTSDLGQNYKGAPSFEISLLHNIGDFTFNTSIGFVSYAPKQDSVAFDPTDPSAGYGSYSHFTSIQIFAGAAYNINISDASKLYIGVDLGNVFSTYSYNFSDGAGGSDSGTESGSQSYIAPKIGIKFPVSDNLDLGIEARYNFMISSDSGSGDTYDYGSSSTVYKSYSGYLTLTYNF